MSTQPPLSHSGAADEAALWAARLDGSSLKDADFADLRAWLDRDPAHRALLSDFCQFSADLERRLSELASAGDIPMPPEVSAQARRPRLFSLTTIALGGALAAAAAIMFIWLRNPQTQYESIATSVGQRRSLVLNDGTHIDLNADTSLHVETDRLSRHVRLASGEAFFHVAKDKSRPFTVETPSGSVRVTGTVFDVSTDAKSELEVAVVEGNVLVHPRPESAAPQPAPVSLQAGDALSSDSSGVSVRHLSASSVEDIVAWTQGQVVFDGTPLSQALVRFARYHGRGISATDAAGRLRLGGRFNLDDLDGFLSGLEEALPVKVTRDSAGTIRVSLRSEP